MISALFPDPISFLSTFSYSLSSHTGLSALPRTLQTHSTSPAWSFCLEHSALILAWLIPSPPSNFWCFSALSLKKTYFLWPPDLNRNLPTTPTPSHPPCLYLFLLYCLSLSVTTFQHLKYGFYSDVSCKLCPLFLHTHSAPADLCGYCSPFVTDTQYIKGRE